MVHRSGQHTLTIHTIVESTTNNETSRARVVFLSIVLFFPSDSRSQGFWIHSLETGVFSESSVTGSDPTDSPRGALVGTPDLAPVLTPTVLDSRKRKNSWFTSGFSLGPVAA